MPRPSKPLGSNTITRVRAPLVSDARDQTLYRDWAHATRTDIHGCLVQPFRMSQRLNQEENRDREYGRSVLKIYMPHDTDLTYTDRVDWNGKEYDVYGQPEQFEDMEGQSAHMIALLRLKEG